MSSGYSGTPLAKKLGIQEGFRVAIVDEPPEFRGLLQPVPSGVEFDAAMDRVPHVVMLFCVERSVLESNVVTAGEAIFPDGAIWVAWPKKASKVPTDITENVVREVALPLGLVDVKVAAISDVWSGLKIVWRKELRH